MLSPTLAAVLERRRPHSDVRRMIDLSLLECPRCRASALTLVGERLICGGCAAPASTADGIAGFLDEVDEVDDYVENYEQICTDDLREPKTPGVVKEMFTRLAVERAHGTVCDLGCGDGFVVRRIEADRRIAVDIAREYLLRLPPDILRIHGWAERTPLRAAGIDTVICTDLLEHVREAEPLAAEIKRILRPGGRLLLAVPYRQDLSVYELPAYKAKYGKYKYVHLRSVDDAMVERLFSSFELGFTHLITEGMELMEFKPYPIKFYELLRGSD